MIIVSGRIVVKPGSRATFLKATDKVVATARAAEGCRDFVIAADPLEKDRVNIYEEWESEAALMKFRGSGPPQDLRAHMVKAEIARHIVKSSGPP
jgi:quinol monooxygenase YgiN